LALLSSVSVSTLVEESYGVIGDASGDNDIEVIDDRGTFDGWTLTMTMTDFFSTSSIIPATSMTITPTSVNVKSGLADGVSAGVVHTFLSDTDPATVMLAADGYGNGNYWNDVDLLLLVPGLTKAGFYSAVVTFSLQ